MVTFLVILLVLVMIATVGALIRGIVIFLQTSQRDLMGGGPNVSGMRQNKMMQARIMFQAIAVLIVILLLMLGHGASNP